MVNDNILERIKHLFAMAEHANSNKYEAAIALEKAQALLLQHNLSRANIDINNGQPANHGIGQVIVTENTGYTWKRHLLGVIAKNNLCSVVGSPSTHAVHLFGSQDNVRSVLEMYYWVVEQLINMATPLYKEYKQDGGYENARKWNAGFYQGATLTIKRRLAKPMDDFQHGTGRDLVLANSNRLKLAVRSIFPSLRKSSYKLRPGDGFSRGRQAGDQVRFGRSKPLATGPKALLTGQR